ncbi:hypothetical protein B0H15DRAFT_865577 [Mycena belliarum]|uniref:F-box domain-containing protein n=1 Tax=Mycena belliarum TaxID=1033014 RepID=A0AAD6TRX6_9AGAR|nr:hypothetical protein B0H15DRAFT_865577 [Mycena belliae]
MSTHAFLSSSTLPALAPIMTAPPEVLHLIMDWASPHDVRVLRSTARIFRQVIDGPQTNSVWRSCFRNVLLELPTTSTQFLPWQIADFMFARGRCTNWQHCGRQTTAVPYSFALKIRFCSLACQYITLRRIPPTPRDSPVMPEAFWALEHHSTVPVPMPYLEGTRSAPLYIATHVYAAWQVFFGQCQVASALNKASLLPQIMPNTPLDSVDPGLDAWMKDAEELCTGAHRYRIARDEVDSLNQDMLERIAKSIGLTLPQLVVSPTLARYINTCSRDLERFDCTGWNEIRQTVLIEVAQRVPWNNNAILCPFCAPCGPRPRQYGEQALERHFQDWCVLELNQSPVVSRPLSTLSHPEHVAEPIAFPNAMRCALCKSTIMYDRDSLLDHVARR